VGGGEGFVGQRGYFISAMAQTAPEMRLANKKNLIACIVCNKKVQKQKPTF